MTIINVFGGDVVLVSLVDPPEPFIGGIPIVSPFVYEKEGVKFIARNMTSDPRDWTSSMQIVVSLNQVPHYLVFASLEDTYHISQFFTFGEGTVQERIDETTDKMGG